jgi:hypothetical protein
MSPDHLVTAIGIAHVSRNTIQRIPSSDDHFKTEAMGEIRLFLPSAEWNPDQWSFDFSLEARKSRMTKAIKFLAECNPELVEGQAMSATQLAVYLLC